MVAHPRDTVAILGRPDEQAAVAAALLAVALADRDGRYGGGAVLVATAAAALALLVALRGETVWGPVRTEPPSARASSVKGLLGVMVAGFLVFDAVKPPAPGLVPARPPAFLALLGVAALVLATYVPPLDRALSRLGAWRARLRLAVWLACAAGMGAVVIRAGRSPWIDVWLFQQEAARTLLAEANPYARPYPNLYGTLEFYGPAVADSALVRGFPYPPETILVGVPAYALLGDVRFAMLAALLVAAWLLARLAPAGLGELAAAALLFHPRTSYVLHQAWTEPTVLAAALGVVLALRWLAARPRRWAVAAVAGALLLGAKQYSPILAAPLVPALPRAVRARAIALAVAVAGVVVLPFALWNPAALWRGVVAMQFLQPLRLDALAWSAALVRLGVRPLPGMLPFLVAAAVLVAAWPRRGELAQGVAAASAAFLLFVLSAKQAFLNYHWLANGLLLATCVLRAGARAQVSTEPDTCSTASASAS
jgi:hypothetical protein